MQKNITSNRLGRTVSGGLAVVFGCLLLGGCATRSNSGSVAQYGLDQAAIFGNLVDEFVLPDGSEASIRQFQGRYSVKLQKYFRVVDIDKATGLRFRSAQMVDGYTLIVLEKSQRNCPSMTHLLAIRGTEVRAWDLGNCRSWPETTILQDAAIFDVPEGRGTTRYRFTDGRLLYGDAPPPAPPVPGRRIQADTGPATSAGKGGAVAAKAGPKMEEVPATASRRSASPAYVPAAAPIFKPKEQAPRTIYLDK